MQDVIRLLPDSVANQIAAGEVVQRPSSVVKELMENSIDAGAAKIQVIILDSGRTLIQVIDDGRGMNETDARMAFERHATSKIKEASDLYALTTMGFRGEALASIAAVSQVELSTRHQNDELGTKISISGSLLEEQLPVMCPIGSNFKIKNLFYNIPARRKFLKSPHTEFANIITEFQRIALSNPEIELSLIHNDNEVASYPASSFKQRVVLAFGKKIGTQLIPVNVATTLISTTGYVGVPESSRKKGVHQFFFVNGRYMRHPYFAKAVAESYSQIIPQGDQIPFFLIFQIDPSRIDVNIHPTKTEVKFDEEPAIWQILSAAVREALGRFNAAPTIDFNTDGMPDIPVFETTDEPIAAPSVSYNPNYNPFKTSASGHSTSNRQSQLWQKLYDDPIISHDRRMSVDLDTIGENRSSLSESNFSKPDLDGINTYMHAYQYKGQYVLMPVKSGLMFIDQRRASFRILFDKYLKQLTTKESVSQRLLFPQRLEYSLGEATLLDSLCDEFGSLGFEISSLGGTSYALLGTPPGIEGIDPEKIIAEILNSVMEQTATVSEKLNELFATVISKQMAIVKGQILSPVEISELLASLFACDIPGRTPDGKPIIHILNDNDIVKYFQNR